MTRQPRRHVWVTSAGGQHAGLILTWRRAQDGSWEAQVAVNLNGSMLVTWTPAGALRPITDDHW